jgi:fibronectin type 3 domain-containing protein
VRDINYTKIVFIFLAMIFLSCFLTSCNDDDSKSDKNNSHEGTWYRDADGDGFGDPESTLTQTAQISGYLDSSGDCDDYDATVYPDAPELCDGKDNNCNGTVDENACEPYSQKLYGRISNFNNAKAYITEESYLQLVPYPAYGQMLFTTDTQGRRVYTSDLAVINMPSDGAFVFETFGLIPGQYVIAAQLVEPYDPASKMSPVLASAENQPKIIVIPENGSTSFEVDLGNVILPLPAAVVETQAGPDMPTGISASDGDFEDKIRVTWNASPDITSYEVYRADSFSGQKSMVTSTTATVYDDTSLPCGEDYYYWVKAVNASGSSDLFYSDLGFVRCPLAPGTTGDGNEDPAAEPGDPVEDPENPVNKPVILDAPTGADASDGTFADKIQITWNASPSASSYDVYRCLTCCSTKVKIGSSDTTAYDDFDVVAYQPYVYMAQQSLTQQSYFYWIKANNANGVSEFSEPDTGYIMIKPPPPTGVRASDGQYWDEIHITWALTPTASSYEVYRSDWGSETKTIIGTTSNSIFIDTEVEPSTHLVRTYIYRVKAVNAAGISDFSDSDSGFVYRTLRDPVWVRATNGTLNGCVEIKWVSVTGASKYDIYRAYALDGEKTKIATVNQPTVLYRDSTTTCPTIYYYWVKSVDAKGHTDRTFSLHDIGYCVAE